MGILSDSVGLLFKIQADGSQATTELGKITALIENGTKSSTSAASASLQSLASDFGITSNKLISLVNNINPVAGIAAKALSATFKTSFKSIENNAAAAENKLKNTFSAFKSLFNQEFTGKSNNLSQLFNIDPQKAGTAKAAFGDFLKGFEALPSAEAKAETAVTLFGTKAAPVIEELAGLGTGAEAAGVSIGAIALPVAVAVAAVVGMTAVVYELGAKLYDVSKQAANFGDKLYQVQVKTGLSAESISALNLAATEGEVSIEKLGNGVSFFEKKVASAKEQNKAAIEVMTRLFGKDWQNQVADANSALANSFNRIAAMTDPFARAKAASDAYGRQVGGEMLKAMDAAGGSFENLIKRANDLSGVMGDQDIKASHEFEKGLRDLELQGKALTLLFAKDLLPIFTQVFTDLSHFLSDNKTTIQEWGSYIATAVKGVVTTFEGLVSFMESHKEVFNTLGTIALYAARGAAGIATLGLSEVGIMGANTLYNVGANEKNTPQVLGNLKLKQNDSKADALGRAAQMLGINPLDLATIIGFETGGTYSPDKVGGANNAYRGLIQFGPAERQKYGVHPGQSFEDQIINSVVPFLRDRFASVEKSTIGASRTDLYRTVLGGNPNASLFGQDAFGTSPFSGVQKMTRDHEAIAKAKFFQQSSGSADTAEDYDRQMEKDSERRKKASEDQKNADAEAKILSQDEIKDAEAKVVDLKRAYDKGLANAEQNRKGMIQNAAAIRDATLNQNKTERKDADDRLAIDDSYKDEHDKKIAELNASDKEANRKYQEAVNKADDEAQANKLKKLRENFAAYDSAQKILDDSRIADIQNQAGKEGHTYLDAANQVAKIKSDQLDRQEKEYKAELKLATGNLTEQKKINDELKKLGNQRTADEAQNKRDREAAEDKDSEIKIQEIQQRQKFLDLQKQQTDSQASLNEQKELQDAKDKYQKLETSFDEYQKKLAEIQDKYFRADQNRQAFFSPTEKDEQGNSLLVGGEMYEQLQSLIEIQQNIREGTKARKKADQDVRDFEVQINIERINQEKDYSAFKQHQHETLIEQIRQRHETYLKAVEEELAAERELADFLTDQERKRQQNLIDVSSGKERYTRLLNLQAFELNQNDQEQAAALKAAETAHQKSLDNIKDKNKEKDAVEALTKAYQAQIDLINGKHDQNEQDILNKSNPDITQQSKKNSGIFGTLGNIFGGLAGGGVKETDSTGKIKSQATFLKGVYADISASANSAVGSMISGLANLATQWITTGKFSISAAAQMVAGILAQLAIEAGFKALFEVAEGYAALANPFTAGLAPGHFAAAAAYGTAAAFAGAGAVALGVASRIGASNSTASSAVASGTGSVSSSASSSSNSSSNSNERTITEGRTLQQQQPEVHYLVFPKGMVDKGVLDGINKRTALHGALVKLIVENS